MAYIQRVKDDEGLEKKPQGKQNINPVGFLPTTPFYAVESWLFSGTWIMPQNKPKLSL